MSKKCNKCDVEKQLGEYQWRNDTGKYRNECKSCCQTRINAYRRENEEYKLRYNEYRKKRRLQDTQFAIMDRLRARIRKMLKAKDGTKYDTTVKLLGCSMEDFKKHLISKFYSDMSWESKNFVLDHIIPCSWFDLSNHIHQKICFNYKNIQPLTEEDNSKKSDKVWTTYNLLKNPYI
jgi:hypothetical protein